MSRWTVARLRRDERGMVAGTEVLPALIVVLVAGTLFLVAVWGTVEAKSAAVGAAREAARAAVEAEPGDAHRRGVSAGLQTLAAHGFGTDAATVTVTADRFARCGTVTATVAVPVETRTFLPGVLVWRGRTVTAIHREVIDPLRSGLDGDARACLQAAS